MTDNVTKTTAQTTGIDNPYVGPRPFLAEDERQGRKLYGRRRETRHLLDLLIAERMVMLYSPSGAGKTSLLNAALIPHLKQKRFEVLPIVRVNQEPPQGFSLPPETNPYIFSLLLYLEEPLPEADQLPLEALAKLSLTAYLNRRQALLTGLSQEEYQAQLAEEVIRPKSLVLIFDQFEEILTVDPTNQQAKENFFVQVGEALQQRWVWAIFSLREDYIAGLDPFLRPIPTRLSTTFRLELLRKEAARQAIQDPAKDFGKTFTDTAAEKLINNLSLVRVSQRDGTTVEKSGIYVEPVQLQVVCSRVWDTLPSEATEIEEEHLSAIGDVDTALANYYADRIKAIAEKHQARERRIRDWFDERLITGQGIRGQVLRTFDASQGLPDPVVDALLDTYLVRAEERRGAIWLELAHDRLIKPIQESNARWREANLSTLQRQAALWDQRDRPDGLLLTGDALTEAEGWAETHADILTPAERDFLTRSKKGREEAKLRLEAAENAARAEENAKTAASLRRRAILIGFFAVVATVLAIVAGVFGVVANNNRQAAQTASTAAIEQKGTAEAASTDAIEQRLTAEAASTEAIIQKNIAENASTAAIHQQNTAEAASTQAIEQQATAEAASTTAIEQKGTAEFASTAAIHQQQTAEAERDVANMAAAERDAAISELKTNLETAAAQSNRSQAERSTAEAQLVVVQETQTAVAVRAATQTAEAEQAIIAATQTALAQQTVPPSFPPQGRIIFASNRDGREGDKYDLYLIEDLEDDDRGGLGPLTNRGDIDLDFPGISYSAETKMLVFGVRDFLGGLSISAKASNGNEVDNIGGVQANNWQPAISPDGQQVAFVSDRRGNPDIYIMDIDGTNVIRLTNHPRDDFMPAWSSDGNFIVYASKQDNIEGQAECNPREGQKLKLWVIEVQSGVVTRLTCNELGDDVHPAWSPTDDRKIAFTRQSGRATDIYIMDDINNPENLRNLTGSPNDENFAAWSPDGSWIVFSRFTTNVELFMTPADGSSLSGVDLPFQLTNNPATDFYPVWIP